MVATIHKKSFCMLTRLYIGNKSFLAIIKAVGTAFKSHAAILGAMPLIVDQSPSQ